MAEDWSAQQRSIADDLRSSGAAFTFTRDCDRTFDPIESAYAGAVPVKFTAYGIFKSLNSAVNFSLSWAPETTIEVGDKLLLLDCAGYTPELEDTVHINGAVWTVKAFSTVEPGGIGLIQTVLIRRV